MQYSQNVNNVDSMGIGRQKNERLMINKMKRFTRKGGSPIRTRTKTRQACLEYQGGPDGKSEGTQKKVEIQVPGCTESV